MSRELSTTNSAECEARVVRPVLLCELMLSTPIRVHSGLGSLTWDSKTWLGVGNLGGVSEIEEGVDVSARPLVLSLSGIPSEYITMALTEEYRNKRARLWIGFLEVSGGFKDTPSQVFGGRVSTMTTSDDGTNCTLSVSLESRLADLRRARVSRYTHEEQIKRYPGDFGLSFVARLANAPIYWGIGKSSPTIS